MSKRAQHDALHKPWVQDLSRKQQPLPEVEGWVGGVTAALEAGDLGRVTRGEPLGCRGGFLALTDLEASCRAPGGVRRGGGVTAAEGVELTAGGVTLGLSVLATDAGCDVLAGGVTDTVTGVT